MPIIQNELKVILDYNEFTGIFTWLKLPKFTTRASIGQEAGCIDKSTKYRYITIQGIKYAAHNLAWLYMTGKLPHYNIDHKDKHRANNIWTNLHNITVKENAKNRTLNKNNISGNSGVSYHKRDKVWMVQINNKYMGQYKTKNKAIKTRKKLELLHNY